jgi:hypothetical protein
VLEASTVPVRETAPGIPWGCTCAYTWAPLAARLVRNGPFTSCPADHTAIDHAPSH